MEYLKFIFLNFIQLIIIKILKIVKKDNWILQILEKGKNSKKKKEIFEKKLLYSKLVF